MLRSALAKGLVRASCAAFLFSAACGSASAVTFLFDTDPFLGTGIDPNDGVRQISAGTAGFGARTVVPGFDFAADEFAFNISAFGLTPPLVFQGAPVQDLIPAGSGKPNVVVLQTTDDDADPATPFGAGNAASLIAGTLTESENGFFIYHNSGLMLNRLVYSTDLSDPTADLAILAAIASPTGAEAIGQLDDFSSQNFAFVPLPAAAPMLAASIALLTAVGWRRRRL
jgi:hypothetical protein